MNASAKAPPGGGIRKCQPGDKFTTPRGQIMYEEPRVALPGCEAWGLFLKGHSIGVLIVRQGNCTLRYCDPAGIVHSEDMPDMMSPEEQAIAAMHRMARLAKQFLGERHPLAEAASANARPA